MLNVLDNLLLVTKESFKRNTRGIFAGQKMKRTTSTRNVPDTQQPQQSGDSTEEVLHQLAKLITDAKNSQQVVPTVPVKKGRKPVESTEEPSAPIPEPKPKRQLSEKQLSALAAGRAKNPRFRPRENPAG